MEKHGFSDIPAPLVHEVNELIEKERTLLELKLLERELQAKAWQSKYEELKDSVIDENGIDEKRLPGLGKVAEVEEVEPDFVGAAENHAGLLVEAVTGNLANFNFKPLPKTVFSSVAKALFGMKSIYPEVDVIWMNDCEVNHDSLEAIEYMLRSSKLKAIDLSQNPLDNDVLYSFVEVLNSKRHTPQYLLLSGISAWSISDKAYLELLHVLSRDTWGLVMSLQDTVSNAQQMLEQTINKGRKKGDRDGDLLYRDIKQPHRAAHFLALLNHKIKESRQKQEAEDEDPRAHSSSANLSATANAKKKKGHGSDILVGRYGKIATRLSNSICDLSVLGLTEHALSKATLHILDTTLILLRNSLTELDLSFAYIGYDGAVLMKKVIADQQSLLISLNLCGNALGDPGAHLIAPSLTVNHTLTNVNLSNSAMSMQGVMEIARAVIDNKVLFMLDVSNNVHHHLDLATTTIDEEEDTGEVDDNADGNKGLHEDGLWSPAREIDHYLNMAGSQLFIKWHHDLQKRPIIWWNIPAHLPVMLSRSRSTSKIVKVGNMIRLARINLTKLYIQHPDYANKPLVIRWRMRPGPMRNLEDVQRDIFRGERWSENKINIEPYALINSYISFGWTISMRHSRHEYLHHEEDASKMYLTSQSFGEQVDYVSFTFIVHQPQKRGILDLKAYIRILRPNTKFHPAKEFMAVDWKHVTVYPLPLTGELYHVGGDVDPKEEEPMTAQVRSFNDYRAWLDDSRLIGHDLSRAMTWLYRPHRGRITWEARLIVLAPDSHLSPPSYDEKKESKSDHAHDRGSSSSSAALAVDEHGRPADHALIDYEWCVSRHPDFEDSEILSSHRCSELLTSRHYNDPLAEKEEDEEAKDKAAAADSLLTPWKWNHFEVDLDHIEQTDVLLLTYKIVSSNPQQAKDLLKHCIVEVRNCQLYLRPDMTEVSKWGHEDYNRLLPIFDDPRAVFQSLNPKEEYPGSEQRARQQADRWRPLFEANGIDCSDEYSSLKK